MARRLVASPPGSAVRRQALASRPLSAQDGRADPRTIVVAGASADDRGAGHVARSSRTVTGADTTTYRHSRRSRGRAHNREPNIHADDGSKRGTDSAPERHADGTATIRADIAAQSFADVTARPRPDARTESRVLIATDSHAHDRSADRVACPRT